MLHRLDESDGSPARLNRRLGVFLRHAPAEQVDLSASPPNGDGRRVRSDDPMPAVRELGLGILRLPAADLLDPVTRRRAELLAADGRRFLILVAGRPSATLLDLLERYRPVILALEAVLADDAVRAWRSCPPRCPVPVRLAPLRSCAATVERMGFGFDSGELDRLTELDLKRDGAFAGVVAGLGPDEPAFSSLLRMVAAVSARELDLNVDLRGPGRAVEQPVADDPLLALRGAEAAFAANALPDAEIVLDSLVDVGLGGYRRDGPLDRRFDLRPAGRAVRTISALPPLRPAGFAWSVRQPGGRRVHGYQSGVGVELLVGPAAGVADGPDRVHRSLTLRLPVDARAFGRAGILGLDGETIAEGRAHADDDDPRWVRIDPPLPSDRPVIVRLA